MVLYQTKRLALAGIHCTLTDEVCEFDWKRHSDVDYLSFYQFHLVANTTASGNGTELRGAVLVRADRLTEVGYFYRHHSNYVSAYNAGVSGNSLLSFTNFDFIIGLPFPLIFVVKKEYNLFQFSIGSFFIHCQNSKVLRENFSLSPYAVNVNRLMIFKNILKFRWQANCTMLIEHIKQGADEFESRPPTKVAQ